MLVLRDYQIDFINQIRKEMQASKEVLGVLPTGAGKTAIASYMLKSASDKNYRSWFIVHKRELVKQSVAAFEKIGARVGVINPDYSEDLRANIQVCSIDTLRNRIHRLPTPHMNIWDEAHHMGAATWTNTFEKYRGIYQIGLTATPWRLDKKGLGRFFPRMVRGPEVEWLIANGYLSDFEVFAKPLVKTDGLKKSMGDFDLKDFEAAAGKEFFGNVVEEYMDKAAGKRAVLFASSINASLEFVKKFAEREIKAVHIDGKMSSFERDLAMSMFASGEAQILSNYGIVGEGLDIPAIEVVILARPTMSLSLFLQMVGRGLRLFPGKTKALILDHVEMWKRHGFADDIRDWTLEDRPKKETAPPSPKMCPKCYYMNDRDASFCVSCGEALTQRKEREDNTEYVDGKLVKIDKLEARIKRKHEEREAKTVDEFFEIGKSRGYKNPRGWAMKMVEIRDVYKRKRGG